METGEIFNYVIAGLAGTALLASNYALMQSIALKNIKREIETIHKHSKTIAPPYRNNFIKTNLDNLHTKLESKNQLQKIVYKVAYTSGKNTIESKLHNTNTSIYQQ